MYTRKHTTTQPRNVVPNVNQAGLFSLPSTQNVLTALPHLTNMQRNTFLTCRVVVIVIGTVLSRKIKVCAAQHHIAVLSMVIDRDRDCTFVARFSDTTYSFLQFTHIQKFIQQNRGSPNTSSHLQGCTAVSCAATISCARQRHNATYCERRYNTRLCYCVTAGARVFQQHWPATLPLWRRCFATRLFAAHSPNPAGCVLCGRSWRLRNPHTA